VLRTAPFTLTVLSATPVTTGTGTGPNGSSPVAATSWLRARVDEFNNNPPGSAAPYRYGDLTNATIQYYLDPAGDYFAVITGAHSIVNGKDYGIMGQTTTYLGSYQSGVWHA